MAKEDKKQKHHPDCGEAGETGEHGDLGSNAINHPDRKAGKTKSEEKDEDE